MGDLSKPENVNIKILKRQIKDGADGLNHEDRMHVLQILKQQLQPKQIIEHADGCRINLDTLEYEIINKLHYIITNRLASGKQYEI